MVESGWATRESVLRSHLCGCTLRSCAAALREHFHLLGKDPPRCTPRLRRCENHPGTSPPEHRGGHATEPPLPTRRRGALPRRSRAPAANADRAPQQAVDEFRQCECRSNHLPTPRTGRRMGNPGAAGAQPCPQHTPSPTSPSSSTSEPRQPGLTAVIVGGRWMDIVGVSCVEPLRRKSNKRCRRLGRMTAAERRPSANFSALQRFSRGS